MLRFILPKLADWTPRHAYIVGPDELCIPSEITLNDGIIDVAKRSEGAASLAIQYPVPAPINGILTLRTTLLPERQTPYLLSLELARYQVMLLLNKLEDWALFDQPTQSPLNQAIEKSLAAYTHALVVQRSGSKGAGARLVEAEAAARTALVASIEAGELLALHSAQHQHAKRVSGELARLKSKPAPANAVTDHEAQESRKRAAGSVGVILPDPPLIGVGVHPAIFAPEACNALVSVADFISVPMRWMEMEPSEGKYAFARTDRWIEWAVTKAKLPVVAGPVLDFEQGSVPDFLYIWEHDYETLRDVVIEYVKNIVTRYRRTVHTWNICSGLHVGSNFAISYEQAIDLTRVCVLVVKKLHPQAKVQIEIAQPWGEYTSETGAKATRSIPPGVYCELLKQVNVEFDALAVKVQMGLPLPGRSTRDLLAFSALLDRFGQVDKPVVVSALAAPGTPMNPGPNALEAGSWRAQWSANQQAHWAARVLAIAAGKPFVQAISWQDICDVPGPNAIPASGLVAPTGPRPTLKVLTDLRAALKSRAPLLPGTLPGSTSAAEV